MKVCDAQEAIEKANDSRLGLSGSVWTRDKAKAMASARRFKTGLVHVNSVLLGVAQSPVPFGGWNNQTSDYVNGPLCCRPCVGHSPICG